MFSLPLARPPCRCCLCVSSLVAHADNYENAVTTGTDSLTSPVENYLKTPLDLTENLIENWAATFLMRVDGE